jgi:hypothetical protein
MNPYSAENIWELPNGKSVALLTPEQLKDIQDGTELVSIGGRRVVVGKDYIDNDTRFGYLAYGIEYE